MTTFWDSVLAGAAYSLPGLGLIQTGLNNLQSESSNASTNYFDFTQPFYPTNTRATWDSFVNTLSVGGVGTVGNYTTAYENLFDSMKSYTSTLYDDIRSSARTAGTALSQSALGTQYIGLGMSAAGLGVLGLATYWIYKQVSK